MATTLWLCGHIMPVSTAWLVALILRVIITGALHEDGLADFFDGFGGGRSKERILAIMKDSHIGTYGVLGLILYLLLMMQLCVIPLETLCVMVLCGDCLAKSVASQLTNLLPYARNEEESKAKVVYNRMSVVEMCVAVVGGLLPSILLLPSHLWLAVLCPLVVFGLLYSMMKRKIQGYTGDCCGATFLLCEISFYISCLILWKLY